MGFILKQLSNDKYVVSDTIMVSDPAFARVFASRKIAFNYIRNNGLPKEDIKLIEENDMDQSSCTRKDMMNIYNKNKF